MTQAIQFLPTRADVEGLNLGDLALDCWGRMSIVTRIFARGKTRFGRAYVLFYTQSGDQCEASNGYTENELCRTLPLCCKFSAIELERIERKEQAARGLPAQQLAGAAHEI